MKAKTKLNKREKIWIHRDEDCNDLTICGEWSGGESPKQFSKEEAKELFEVVKNAIQAKYPNITINPWGDAEHGTLD